MFLSESLAGGAILLMLIALLAAAHDLNRKRKNLAITQQAADDILQRARHLSTMAALDQPFAVCESCNQIRTRYVRDENGVTCIECAEKHTQRDPRTEGAASEGNPETHP